MKIIMMTLVISFSAVSIVFANTMDTQRQVCVPNQMVPCHIGRAQGTSICNEAGTGFLVGDSGMGSCTEVSSCGGGRWHLCGVPGSGWNYCEKDSHDGEGACIGAPRY
jgi:hypothetical protein